MTKRFEFEYDGCEPGFCRSDFKRRVQHPDGKVYTNQYCILVPDGAHTSTRDWKEPNSPFREDILQYCWFQKVPDESSMAKETNAWIIENTAGLLPDDHKFEVTILEEIAK